MLTEPCRWRVSLEMKPGGISRDPAPEARQNGFFSRSWSLGVVPGLEETGKTGCMKWVTWTTMAK